MAAAAPDPGLDTGPAPASGAATEPGAAGDPLRQLIDLVVYAPVGIFTAVTTDLPKLVATGKARVENQLTMARFVGKMAVRQVKSELDRRLDLAEQARAAAAPAAGVADGSTHRDGKPRDITPRDITPRDSKHRDSTHQEPTSLPEAVLQAVAESPELADPATLPIDGYESLAASQVVLRLGSLTPGELAAVAEYESSHRARRTILGKIHQLQAS